MTVLPPIAALASGWACSPRALIRISGDALLGALTPVIELPGITHRSGNTAGPLSPGVYRARVNHSPPISWPAVALWSPAPRSYTGQDTLELLVPGGRPLIERLLARLAQIGVREAGPGEFTARAFLNGRLSAEQAEGVAALIAARNTQDLAAARGLLSGESGHRYRGWTEQTARLLALVEAGIDFTDQEAVVPITPSDLAAGIAAIAAQVRDHLGAAAGTELCHHEPCAVLIGRPNAGKSTLFNALLDRARAVASPLAGTTRDVLAERLDLTPDVPSAASVRLCDLPGLDADPADVHARAAQAAAHEAIRAADILILCIPVEPVLSSRSAAAEAASLLRALAPPGDPRPLIVVRTKADLAPPAHGTPATARAAEIAVSALDGENLPRLRRAIADAALVSGDSGVAGSLLPRHRRTLALALAELVAAADQLRAGSVAAEAGPALHTPEIIALHLRHAADHFGELTGRISPDDVLGRIFASFCIGK